jgi:hypothetical protein
MRMISVWLAQVAKSRSGFFWLKGENFGSMNKNEGHTRINNAAVLSGYGVNPPSEIVFTTRGCEALIGVL